jgi:hypothetical protein
MAIRYLDEQPKSSIKYIEEDPGLLKETGTDLARRGRNIAEAYKATDFRFPGQTPEQGQQSELEFLAQTGGQVIGGAGDVLGNLASSGYREFTPEPVQEAVSSGMKYIGESPVGKYLGNIAGDVGEWYGEQSPRTQRNLGALGNLAPIVPLGKLGSLVPFGEATRVAGKGMRSAASKFKVGVDNIIKQADNLDATALKAASNQAYKAADDIGASIKPTAMHNYAVEITSIPDIKTAIGEEAAKKVGKATGLNQLQKAKEIINSMAGRTQKRTVGDLLTGTPARQNAPIGLRSFNDVDQTLSEMLYAKGSKLLSDNGSLNRAGQQVKAMQEALRDKVLNVSVDDVVGDKEAFAALKTARDLWSKQIKVRNIEDIIKRAGMSNQPTTAIKTSFKNIVTNPKKRALYNAAELKVMEEAANVGKLQEVLNLFGSRLPSAISTGTGDFVTGAALRAGSEIPRSAASNMQLKKAQQVINTIAGVQKPRAGVGMARSLTGAAAKMPANVLGTMGTGMQLHAPQLTALGLLNQQQENK